MQKPQEMQVQSLGREDSLEEGMATHSSILAWMFFPSNPEFVTNRSEVNHVMTIIISIQDCLLYYKFRLSFIEGLSSFNIVAVITYLNVN